MLWTTLTRARAQQWVGLEQLLTQVLRQEMMVDLKVAEGFLQL